MASFARRPLARAISIADAASWYCALGLVALILLCSLRESPGGGTIEPVRGGKLVGRRPCDEIYVVGEGETLHTISDKCGDPFIVEQNPHIHDPDDVFPGLVIKITPSKPRLLLAGTESRLLGARSSCLAPLSGVGNRSTRGAF